MTKLDILLKIVIFLDDVGIPFSLITVQILVRSTEEGRIKLSEHISFKLGILSASPLQNTT